MYSLNGTLNNIPQSRCREFSNGSCTHLCGPSCCRMCCINSIVDDHTYCVLRHLCQKIITDLQREQCREKYTVFDGGNSINARLYRPSSTSCQTSQTRGSRWSGSDSGRSGGKKDLYGAESRGKSKGKKKGAGDNGEDYDETSGKGKRKKKKKGTQNGDDEDGELGKRGKGKSKSKGDDDEDEGEESGKKRKGKSKGKKNGDSNVDESDETGKGRKGKGADADSDDVTAAKKGKRKYKAKKGSDDDDEADETTVKQGSKSKGKKKGAKSEDSDDDDDSGARNKSRGKGKSKDGDNGDDNEDAIDSKRKGKKRKGSVDLDAIGKRGLESLSPEDQEKAMKKICANKKLAKRFRLSVKCPAIADLLNTKTRSDEVKVCDILRARLEQRLLLEEARKCRCGQAYPTTCCGQACPTTCGGQICPTTCYPSWCCRC